MVAGRSSALTPGGRMRTLGRSPVGDGRITRPSGGEQRWGEFRTGPWSSARATSACHWPCGPWRPASTWSASRSTRARSSCSTPATRYVEDISDERLAAALASGRYRASGDQADLADFDVAVISVPTPMGDGVPDLSYIESAAATLAPYITPRVLRHPGVHHLPRHHRGAGRPDPGGTAPACSPARTSTWATAPSASTPATPPGRWRTPPRSSRASTPPRCTGSRTSSTASSRRPCRSRAPGRPS